MITSPLVPTTNVTAASEVTLVWHLQPLSHFRSALLEQQWLKVVEGSAEGELWGAALQISAEIALVAPPSRGSGAWAGTGHWYLQPELNPDCAQGMQ